MRWPLRMLHRLYLKIWPGWRVLRFADGRCLQIRYFAEGDWNFVYSVKAEARLLKLTKEQYYHLDRSVDEELTAANVALLNSLAASGLSVAAEHLFGGAMLVEHAGSPLPGCRGVPWSAVAEAFLRLRSWALESGRMVLDIGDDNWCWDGHRLRLVDADMRASCPLAELTVHPLSRRRLGEGAFTAEEALSIFVASEEEILHGILAGQGVLAAPEDARGRT